MMRTPITLALIAAVLLVLVACAALGWIYLRQERLIFQPDILPADHAFTLGADVHEEQLTVPGATLSALHLRLPAPRGVVFFLHGNGGSLASWFVNIDFYRRANFDLYMIDYRGYGKSSGRIESEAQLHADVRAAWDHIAPRYAGLRRVIFGRSLGTALAARLAAEVSPELTVLVSPYFSMQRLAKEQFPLVPGSLLRYPLSTGADAERLKGRLLLIHGGRDALIPPHHSEDIAAAVPRATLVRLPEAGHNDLQEFEAYLAALRDAFAAL